MSSGDKSKGGGGAAAAPSLMSMGRSPAAVVAAARTSELDKSRAFSRASSLVQLPPAWFLFRLPVPSPFCTPSPIWPAYLPELELVRLLIMAASSTKECRRCRPHAATLRKGEQHQDRAGAASKAQKPANGGCDGSRDVETTSFGGRSGGVCLTADAGFLCRGSKGTWVIMGGGGGGSMTSDLGRPNGLLPVIHHILYSLGCF